MAQATLARQKYEERRREQRRALAVLARREDFLRRAVLARREFLEFLLKRA
jgi:hypothetical protein